MGGVISSGLCRAVSFNMDVNRRILSSRHDACGPGYSIRLKHKATPTRQRRDDSPEAVSPIPPPPL